MGQGESMKGTSKEESGKVGLTRQLTAVRDIQSSYGQRMTKHSQERVADLRKSCGVLHIGVER
jgi:hypothetical protein